MQGRIAPSTINRVLKIQSRHGFPSHRIAIPCHDDAKSFSAAHIKHQISNNGISRKHFQSSRSQQFSFRPLSLVLYNAAGIYSATRMSDHIRYQCRLSQRPRRCNPEHMKHMEESIKSIYRQGNEKYVKTVSPPPDLDPPRCKSMDGAFKCTSSSWPHRDKPQRTRQWSLECQRTRPDCRLAPAPVRSYRTDHRSSSGELRS
jgi:hypothetical protein